jgi:antitoxin PrlF
MVRNNYMSITKTGRITSKGQVTIPKEIRQTLSLESGDRLLFTVEGERLIVAPIRQRSIGELFGSLPATRPFPGVDAVREEVKAKRGKRLVQGE